MMGRVSGDCFDMRRSWERASMRAASETELSFETRLRIVRGLGSILLRACLDFGWSW